MLRPVVILALLLVTVTRALSQETVFAASGQSNPLDNSDLFPRAAAMGSAFVGVADDASALFLNPAGLGFLDRGQLALNSDLGLVNTVQETLLLGLPLPQACGFAVAGSYLDYGSFDGRDSSGLTTGSYGADRLGLAAGWGMEAFHGWALGAALKGGLAQLAGTTYTSLALDLGVLWKCSDRFRVGAAFNNIGLASPEGGSESALNLGASYAAPLDADNRLLAAVGGTWEPQAVNFLQAGVEYGFQRVLFLRLGFEQPLSDNALSGLTGLTAGIGVDLSGFRFDYAFLPYGDLGVSHRISLGYSFGTVGRERAAGSPRSSVPNGAAKALPAGNAPSPNGYPYRGGAALPDLPPLPPLSGTVPSAAAKGWNPSGPAPSIPHPEGNTSPAPTAGDSGNTAGRPAADSPDSSPSGAKDSLVVQFDLPDSAAPTGDDLEKQGKYQEAAEAYKAEVQKNPQDAASWWALGDLYRRFHQKAAALQCFQRVLRLRPDNPKLADWLQQYELSGP